MRAKAGDRGTTSTSRSLIAGAHANDPAAWDRLVLLYAPLVWHWCRKLQLPAQETADVIQEVFHAVAVHMPDFHRDQPGDTFRGWLRTITTNKVHDHFRRHQREPQGVGGTEAKAWWSQLPDAAGALEVNDRGEEHPGLFRRALDLIQADFEERTWRAFWLVVIDGRSPQEVAAELAMSPGAVRVAKCRVLQRLRQELGDFGGAKTLFANKDAGRDER
jgi:RNA polymerase sigma-70 factor, ECF subfamily